MNDFTEELAKLHRLSGAEFSRQVERIAQRKEFHPLETDKDIYSIRRFTVTRSDYMPLFKKFYER